MTKKLAELSGSVSVISASLILVLATLISSLPMPVLPTFSAATLEVKAESVPEEAAKNQGGTKTLPIPAQEDLTIESNNLFSVANASFSSRLFDLKSVSENVPSTHFVLGTTQTFPAFVVTASVSQEEYALLLYCVEHETTGSITHKALITQVIFNRVQGPGFGSTVKDVILSSGQFDPMVNYQGWGDWQPAESTIEAVNLVLSGNCPDYSQGAVYFCNPYIVGEGNWFDMTRQSVCEIEGHRFYK